MKRIKAGVIVVVALFIAASVSAGVKDGQCPEGSNPTDKNALRFTNSIGMEFVPTPAGTGKLGTGGWKVPDGFRDVEFPDGFYLQATEVTQRQYKILMGEDPSIFKYRRDDFPVESVSKADALEFIRRLNEMEGTTVYRLPTSNEWEYACRAGSTTVFSTGDCIGADQANIHGPESDLYYCPDVSKIRLGRPQPVKSYPPNAWGFYDMHGNVKERVAEKILDHTGRSNNVVMGGCYFQDASNATSYYRETQGPFDDYKTTYIGFRVLASRGINPKAFTVDSEPYVDSCSEIVPAKDKAKVLKSFFTIAGFGEPTQRFKRKNAEFTAQFSEAFKAQEGIKHINPLVVGNRIDEPQFAPYVAINPDVSLDAFGYDGYEHVATGDLAVFEVDCDDNPDNGKEIVVFGGGYYHPFSRLPISPKYKVFHRKDLSPGGGYTPSWTHKALSHMDMRVDSCHGIMQFKCKTLFWSAWWYESSEQFYFNLETYHYNLSQKNYRPFLAFVWTKNKKSVKGVE